jgi:hypothetical protein
MNMTDEEILSAAEACGMMLFGLGMDKAKFEFSILAFAKFVGKIERFKEREDCAKLLDEEAIDAFSFDDSIARATETYAATIRARGEA